MPKNRSYCQAIRTFVLAVYLLVGVAGHLDSLSLLYRTHAIHLIKKTSLPFKQTSQVFWTQHKHIPASSQSLSLDLILLHQRTQYAPQRYLILLSEDCHQMNSSA